MLIGIVGGVVAGGVVTHRLGRGTFDRWERVAQAFAAVLFLGWAAFMVSG